MTRKLLIDGTKQFYLPSFLFQEFRKYLPELLRKAKISHAEDRLIELLSARNIITADIEYYVHLMDYAVRICPDPADAHYFALALKLNCAIWSNDKLLKKQDAIRVFSTEELSRLP